MAAWTPEEDDLLCQLRAKDEGIAAIMTRFPHRSRGAVQAHIQELISLGRIARRVPAGTPRVRWTKREDALIVSLRKKHATIPEITEALSKLRQGRRLPSRTERAVSTRIHHLLAVGKLEPRGRKGEMRAWSRSDDRKLEQLRERYTMPEIAAAMGRSLPSVNGRIARKIASGELRRLRDADSK